jgi:hypothetical protein
MSAREFPAVDATAFRLAALLEQYEQDVEELTATWWNAEVYERVNQGLSEMRLLCAGLPQMSVAWVHVLISHAELVNCLWRSATKPQDCRSPEDCKAEHLLAVGALRQKCLRHFSRIGRSC